MFDWKNILKNILSPKEYIGPRCPICGGQMFEEKPTGFHVTGVKIYVCKYGHEYSPGLDVGDKDNLIEKSKGDTHGEI